MRKTPSLAYDFVTDIFGQLVPGKLFLRRRACQTADALIIDADNIQDH